MENDSQIVTLDENVLRTLDFFIENPPPSIDIKQFKSPFVVGSGNAFNTGAILFSGKDAVLTDESNFKSILKSSNIHTSNRELRDVVIISASGEKDSVWEVELAKKYGLFTTLLTTRAESEAAKIADKTIVFKSIDEPYTYNTSTYMGMILAVTHEEVIKIKEFILGLKFPDNFAKYVGYSFVVPDKFMQICPMLEIKRDELFGSYLSLRAFSQGHARHAKYVNRNPQELVITLGEKNQFFGDPKHRWDISFSDDFNFAAIMAITYYIVGKIQTAKPPYYMENIKRYVSEDGPAAYGQTKAFEVIVPKS